MELQSNSLNDAESHQYITFIGRLTYLKGFDKFITIAKKVDEKWPKFPFLVIGDGPLSSLISANAQLKITHFKQIPYDQMDRYYLQSKILLICSITEGLPTIILEAMKFGVPVVSSYVGGIPEVIIEWKKWISLSINQFKLRCGKNSRSFDETDLRAQIIKQGYETISYILIGKLSQKKLFIYTKTSLFSNKK